jgi:hypothetical protein
MCTLHTLKYLTKVDGLRYLSHEKQQERLKDVSNVAIKMLSTLSRGEGLQTALYMLAQIYTIDRTKYTQFVLPFLGELFKTTFDQVPWDRILVMTVEQPTTLVDSVLTLVMYYSCYDELAIPIAQKNIHITLLKLLIRMKEDPIEKVKWPTLMKIMLSLSRKRK